MSFKDLGVIEPIVNALKQKGYQTPTPIQQEAIPALLSASDVIASAQTGTGKTASFSIPLLQRLSLSPNKKGVRGLVLTPTRELALQVSDNLNQYGKQLSLRSVLVFGGVSQTSQVQQIRKGCDIIVATPGRLLDLIQQKILNLSSLDMLIMDEADRMLDMGFIRDVKRILSMAPASCQKVLLSATMPPEIQTLASGMLRNPVKINIASKPGSVKIQQSVYYVNREKKRELLKHVIRQRAMRNVIVFSRTKRGADKIAADLLKAGISAEAFHGNKSQGARQRALSNFKTNSTRVLVATDIASRGIDISHLPFVINFEMPDTIETYTHRIGRTGRAGNQGEALSFCDNEERPQVKHLQRLPHGQVQIIDHPFLSK